MKIDSIGAFVRQRNTNFIADALDAFNLRMDVYNAILDYFQREHYTRCQQQLLEMDIYVNEPALQRHAEVMLDCHHACKGASSGWKIALGYEPEHMSDFVKIDDIVIGDLRDVKVAHLSQLQYPFVIWKTTYHQYVCQVDFTFFFNDTQA